MMFPRSFEVFSSTSGEDWPTRNAFQDVRNGPGDAIVAKLSAGQTIGNEKER